MARVQKTAIARIFNDLIMADRIVDVAEMECWHRVCAKYSIGVEERVGARGISFAAALDMVEDSGVEGLKEDLLADCRSMTVSDGFCAHSEALLMFALSALLDSDSPFSGEAISIPRASFNIDVATVLYVENDYDEVVNDVIRRNYRAIFKELQLAGFHFVYIPKIIEHYRHTDTGLFREILEFLAPGVSAEGLDTIMRSLMSMTTGGFCKDLLCNKCGIAELRNTSPSLLIKIGNSFVGETEYANYLRLDVDRHIMHTVEGIADRFTAMLSSDMFVVNTSEERNSQFHFHGFYKQLLDIFLIRKNIRSTILINPYREEIVFPEIDTKARGLHRRERALYALLLCYGSAGVRFGLLPGETPARHRARMERIQRRFAAIYSLFGGDKDTAPDLATPEIRRPIVACLRRSIKSLGALYNPEDYSVTKGEEGELAVHIGPEEVFVASPLSGEPVPLADSELYRRFTNA